MLYHWVSRVYFTGVPSQNGILCHCSGRKRPGWSNTLEALATTFTSSPKAGECSILYWYRVPCSQHQCNVHIPYLLKYKTKFIIYSDLCKIKSYLKLYTTVRKCPTCVSVFMLCIVLYSQCLSSTEASVVITVYLRECLRWNFCQAINVSQSDGMD
jgi:hypothetical protein